MHSLQAANLEALGSDVADTLPSVWTRWSDAMWSEPLSPRRCEFETRRGPTGSRDQTSAVWDESAQSGTCFNIQRSGMERSGMIWNDPECNGMQLMAAEYWQDWSQDALWHRHGMPFSPGLHYLGMSRNGSYGPAKPAEICNSLATISSHIFLLLRILKVPTAHGLRSSRMAHGLKGTGVIIQVSIIKWQHWYPFPSETADVNRFGS